MKERLARAWPWLAVLALSFAFRAPMLISAALTNSDAAVVGLQAMHLARGEHAARLWGSVYQTSIDSYAVAAVFAILGPTPLALTVTPLLLHVALTWLAYDVLRRRTSATMAALLVLPLVFTPAPSHTYVLFPPRQAALTIAMAAAWLVERARDAKNENALRVAAGVATSLAVYADPYALVMVPVVGILALGSPRKIGSFALGAIAGAVPLAWLLLHAPAPPGQLGLSASLVSHNAHLLFDPCLPWAIGARAWAAKHVMDYAPWEGPAVVRAIEAVGGWLFAAAILAGGVLAITNRTAPARVRLLGLAGAAAVPITLAGFLASVMVMDAFSSRYLATIILFAPFALAPLALRLGERRFAILLAPCMLATAIAGWVGYAPAVSGLGITRVNDDDERTLAKELHDRGVTYAYADYWVSYRLTFLLREDLVVVPSNLAEDRYPPYRKAFDAETKVAYVFDPLRSREALKEAPDLERVQAGRLTAFLVDRSSKRLTDR